MSLMKTQRIVYKDAQKNSEKIEFVHEVLKTKECASFKKPHMQNFYELIFFNSGSRDLMIGDHIITCTVGDIVILTPEEIHRGRSHDCLLDRYVLHFGRNAFSAFGRRGQKLLRLFTDRPKYTGNVIRLSASAAEEVGTLLADTDKVLHMEGDREFASLAALSNITKIMILLTRTTQQKEETDAPSRTMLRILAYIDTNYAEIRFADELCREFGISHAGLWRMFRQHLQQTPGAYIRHVRLENARYALEKGESLMDICENCGFSDCSHFIRLFREAYGITPYRYQKEYANYAAD